MVNRLFIFSAPWCQACKSYKHKLEESNIGFTEIDIEQEPSTAEAYNIVTLPTTIIESPEGKVMGKLEGAQSPLTLKQVLKDLL